MGYRHYKGAVNPLSCRRLTWSARKECNHRKQLVNNLVLSQAEPSAFASRIEQRAKAMPSGQSQKGMGGLTYQSGGPS